MKKDTSYTIERAYRFPVILIGEGLLVGILGGLVVLLYRIALTYAGEWLSAVLNYIEGNPLRIAGWFVALILLAVIVGGFVKWEPLISGSGIPQIEGEMIGKINQTWWRVLAAKFVGGFLSLLGGLSLGREGPSIQLGAMVGKGVSRFLDRGRTEEKYLLTCGASAGLSAAFHAPLAGVMFSLEEIHKGFSVSILISVMTASLSADYISSHIIGLDPVFDFTIEKMLPQNYYWMLILLGIVLGFAGVFYNWFLMKVKYLYRKADKIGVTGKLLIPFLLAGILGLLMPSVLGSGSSLIHDLTSGEMLLKTVIVVLVVKFLFSAVSFGSGAPGGIFFPLLVLGAMIGGAFALIGVSCFGLDPVYVNNFVLLAMAGYFTAIVRAPITGIILIFEMSGSVSQMLSLGLVSVVAYVVATLMKSEPIYESLLADLLSGKKGAEKGKVSGSAQKVLKDFVVMSGSVLEGRCVQEISWPDNCLLVALKRGEEEMIPRGKTRLLAGDVLTTMTDERDAGYLHDKMEKLCYTSF